MIYAHIKSLSFIGNNVNQLFFKMKNLPKNNQKTDFMADSVILPFRSEL